MLAKLKAYWQSKASNIHALILFLGGSAGIGALHLMHVPDEAAKFVGGACMVLGALLYTPGQP